MDSGRVSDRVAGRVSGLAGRTSRRGPAGAAPKFNPRRRLTVMLVVMVVALGLVGVRLVDLQAVGSARYDALARDQAVRRVVLPATRGTIFDRSGRDLALSVPLPTIYADPSQIQSDAQRARTARALAPVLGRPEAEVLATIAKPKSVRFVYLAHQVSQAVARRVAALGLVGVGAVADSKRMTPAARLAGPVIGFTGVYNQGLGGIESQYDDALKGVPGSLAHERDPSGREIPAAERREVAAKRGSDLVLTLDQSLQYLVEQQLTAEVRNVNAKAGMAAIVDVRTGDVLAMANVSGATQAGPAGPARPAGPAGPEDRNRLVTDSFEPGSTAKVVTIASALESGALDLDTRFSVPASIKVGGQEFQDVEPHGTEDWTVREIVAKSSNVGTIQIAQRVDRTALDQTMRDFGFGAFTALRFPGEQYGTLQAPTTIDPSIMGSMPIGYGIATTAMQTLGVFATVANDGVRQPARLVAATIDPDGERHTSPQPAARRVISSKTASTLNELLRGVVADGTGKKAAIPGYVVAGKTGTSRKPPYRPPYLYMASFGGFAPAEAPRFAAVVVLDEPQGQVHGGAVAAPVFSSIMQAALRLYHVAPSSPVGSDAGRSSQVTPAEAGNVSASVR